MLFSYNWLQSFFKKKLPKPEKLAEILTMHFAEVEEVKKAGKDFTLDIDVRPNRAGDCFSHFGIAREIAAITGSIFRGRTSEDIKEDDGLKAKDFVKVEVREKEGCPRYTARVIVDVKIGPSPEWIRDRLEVCGLRPINNIVDIVNYVMLETGQPLHAFDLEKLEGENPKSKIPNPKEIPNPKSQRKKLIVRFAMEREKIVTLDEEKYDLDENILVIADEKKPVAIAGIKGGKLPEVDNKTKIVVLESANFDPKIIRRGSLILNLKTDASLRFEHGIDPNLTESAINRAAYLIQEIAKGKPAQGLVDVYPKKILPKRIKLDLNYVKSLLGVEIPEIKIKNILNRLGFKLKVQSEKRKTTAKSSKFFEVEIPTRRLDVSIQEDLIEEIGRLYGYEKIQASFPIAALIPPKRNLNVFWEGRTKDILKEAGFSEVYNYSFLSERDISIYRLNQRESALIEVENPISSEQKYLRPSLIPNLLKNLEKNQKNFSEMKIFELGKIFKDLKEKKMLAGLMTGDAFYEAKGIIDLLLNKLGISDIYYDEYKPTPAASKEASLAPKGRAASGEPRPVGREESKIAIWYPKRCAEIKVGQEEIGFLGEISPKILETLKIESRAVVFDINFEKISKLASEEQEYKPLSKYPAAVRDIAILVPGQARVEKVLNEIYEAGGALIRDIDLFDIYEGEELPQGKKNLAFHIIYQAEDRTLSSKEIDEIQNKIIKALEEEAEWVVRK